MNSESMFWLLLCVNCLDIYIWIRSTYYVFISNAIDTLDVIKKICIVMYDPIWVLNWYDQILTTGRTTCYQMELELIQTFGREYCCGDEDRRWQSWTLEVVASGRHSYMLVMLQQLGFCCWNVCASNVVVVHSIIKGIRFFLTYFIWTWFKTVFSRMWDN